LGGRHLKPARGVELPNMIGFLMFAGFVAWLWTAAGVGGVREGKRRGERGRCNQDCAAINQSLRGIRGLREVMYADAATVRGPDGSATVPGDDRPGSVTRTANALQPDTRTLLTEIDVPNPGQVLSPGLYCTVELKIPRKTPSLIIPSDAIIFNRSGLSIAVVEDGITRIRSINVVRDFGTTVEVNRGVKEGDQVILTPPIDLTDGRKVNIRPAPPGQLS